jgi:hypothetical protein
MSERTIIEVVSESYVNCQTTLMVQQASRLVGQQIMEQILIPEGTRKIQSERGKDTHMMMPDVVSGTSKTPQKVYPAGQILAVVLENFGQEVLLPYFLARAANEDCCRHPSTLDHDRIFYATLLAFQEILVQNADTFFVLPESLQMTVSSSSSSSSPSNSSRESTGIQKPNNIVEKMNNNDSKTSVCELEEDYNHLKWVMATSIVLGACQASGRDDAVFMDLLVNTVPQIHNDDDDHHHHHQKQNQQQQQQHYDELIAELSSYTKVRTMAGTILSSAETMAWKISQLLALRSLRAKKQQGQLSTNIPEPTACWISVVESIPSSFTK